MTSLTGPATFFGFDAGFLQQLTRLAVINHKPIVGPLAGPRRSPQHGSSVEFADFRQYMPGDDFRRIDWNAYARLDRLFLHLYTAEQMTNLSILLDHSSSMAYGEPTKAMTAGRLAAVISFLGLHRYDRVTVAGWGQGIDAELSGQSGKASVARVWQSIVDLVSKTEGSTDFGALREYANRKRQRGLAVVISDFLSDSDWQGGLRALRAAGKEVTAIQILAPEEIDPSVRGDWTLCDCESEAMVEVTISPRLLRRYQEELTAHIAALSDFCGRNGVTFLQLRSDLSLVDDLLSPLREAGVVG